MSSNGKGHHVLCRVAWEKDVDLSSSDCHEDWRAGPTYEWNHKRYTSHQNVYVGKSVYKARGWSQKVKFTTLVDENSIVQYCLSFFFNSRKEINVIQASGYGRGILLSFIIITTRFAMFLTLITYVLAGNNVDAEKVFVLTSFYNILRQTMTVFFPSGIAQIAEALVSVKRLQVHLIPMIILKAHSIIHNIHNHSSNIS